MATLNNNGSITTTNLRVGWTVGNAHNFVVTNLNDGPVKITVTPNNGLEFSNMQIGSHGPNSINHHNIVGESFVLEGDSGLFLRLEAATVDSTPGDNTVTFAVSDLHTGVRNPTDPDDGAVFIALQIDVQNAAI